MSIQVNWSYDPSVAITNFTVQRSTDKGVTFTTVATVPFNTASGAPNWNPQLKQFFYVDAGGEPGYIYAVISNGANGVSVPEYTYAPPTSMPMCDIFGYIVDGFGSIDQATPVHIRTVGSKGERWIQGPVGIVAQNNLALAVTTASRTVHPDATGVWQASLIQGVYAKVEIPDIDFVWAFEVPAKPGPINIRDIPQLRGAALGVFPEMAGERSRYPES